MPRQNASWSHVKPGLNTTQRFKSSLHATFFFTSFTAIERPIKKVLCIHSMHVVTMWHMYTLWNIYQRSLTSTSITSKFPWFACGDNTDDLFSCQTSSNTGLTTVSMLHTPPKDALILQLKSIPFDQHLPFFPTSQPQITTIQPSATSDFHFFTFHIVEAHTESGFSCLS